MVSFLLLESHADFIPLNSIDVKGFRAFSIYKSIVHRETELCVAQWLKWKNFCRNILLI